MIEFLCLKRCIFDFYKGKSKKEIYGFTIFSERNDIMSEIRNLHQLLSESSTAKEYYLALPDYVQGMLEQRNYEIHSEEELKHISQALINTY